MVFQWQTNYKCGSLPYFRDKFNLASQHIHKSFRNRKSKATSLCRLTLFCMSFKLMKLPENNFLICFLNSFSGIRYSKNEPIGVLLISSCITTDISPCMVYLIAFERRLPMICRITKITQSIALLGNPVFNGVDQFFLHSQWPKTLNSLFCQGVKVKTAFFQLPSA